MKENEQILKSQKVVGVKPALRDEADNLFVQRKNTRIFFGVPFAHLVYLHKLGENGFLFFKGYNQVKAIDKRNEIEKKFKIKLANAKTENQLKKIKTKRAKKLDKIDRKIREGNLLMRWGEPLAIYNHKKSQQTAEKIKTMMFNNGYFRAKVIADTSGMAHSEFKKSEIELYREFSKKKNHFAEVTYHIIPNKQFQIDSIIRIYKDDNIKKLVFKNKKKLPIKTNKGYSQDKISEERDFISNLAQNNGYYNFSKQYISFQVDSASLGNEKLIIKEIISNPENKNSHQIYTIDSVVYTASSYRTARSQLQPPQYYNNITYIFGKTRYTKKIINWRIAQRKGELYSKENTLKTQRQLSYLNIFKFVEVNYDTTHQQMTANIFSSPIDKFQTSFEAGLSSTVGRPGPFANASLTNRNSFNGLEVTTIDAKAKLEDLGNISEIDSTSTSLYTRIQYGTNLSISFPQFLFPLGRRISKITSSYAPSSILSFGLNFENRIGFFKRTTISSSFKYKWRVKGKLFYTIEPIGINYVRSQNSTEFNSFLDDLQISGSTYGNSFKSAMINSSSLQTDLFFGKYQEGGDGGYARLQAEVGGHYNDVFKRRDDLAYYHYLKFSLDIRRIHELRRKLKLAYRFNVGIARPILKTNSLPYEKYFFAGGSNSIRAWKPRRLGPGSLATFEKNGNTNFTREQPGEILLVSSIELRQKLSKGTELAAFIDAGNTWRSKTSLVSKEKDPHGDDGVFKFNTFLSELAVGGGIGLRFDLSFLILRADFAMKMVDPAQAAEERWVAGDVINKFKENTELNIAIGYPF